MLLGQARRDARGVQFLLNVDVWPNILWYGLLGGYSPNHTQYRSMEDLQ